MRTTFLVCYDICDDKRLRKVAEVCCDFGVRLQYSVFECDLNASEKVQMEGKLTEIIDQDKDQVIFVSLGAAQNRGEGLISAIGRPYTKMAAQCYVF